ncbi:MAG: 1,4-alpha-glucan branching protein GlgB [Egibacteraceae bacterium]
MSGLEAWLASWLPEQRWFQGKARTIRAIEVADTALLDGRVLDVIVEVEYTDGPSERYQVPVLSGASGEDWGMVDATDDAAACRLLAQLAVTQTPARTAAGARLVSRSVTGTRPVLDAPHRLSGDQSNTSVAFGQEAILKVFRRLEPGVNPDVEVTGALTRMGFPHVPAQHGVLELEGDPSTTLAMLSEFVHGRDGFEAARAEAGAGTAETPVLNAVHRLGVVVAELHEALREAFCQTEGSARAAATRAAEMRARAEQVLSLAALRAPAAVEVLLARRDELLGGLDALAAVGDLGPLVRVHGDLHLGQALLAESGSWKLLDFEGEPARPLAERRARSSPLRDVAGMLRSFDYVAGAQPSEAALRWRDQARERFLEAYLDRAGSSGLLPRDPEPVLAAFELDKAAYELGYELMSRPDWVAIPVAGITRVLDAAKSPRSVAARSSQTTDWRAHPDDVRALMAGEYADPHRILGAHPVSTGAVVRTHRPDAERVDVLIGGRAVEARQTVAGFFEALLDKVPLASEYRLRVTYPGKPDNGVYELVDPYAFWPTLGEIDLHLIGEGRHEELWRRMGARPMRIDGIDGTAFSVWAPNARAVRLIGDFNSWDGRLYPMRLLGSSGIWELFMPGVGPGTLYKYEIIGGDGRLTTRADPHAFAAELPPGTASRVFRSTYAWSDEAWLDDRSRRALATSPMSIYEVHLGSWRRKDGLPLGYRELAVELADHVIELGFTHVELLPVAEHPYGGSWGYQVTGYFAPTARYGSPDDFRALVDCLHQRGIGVLVDWVPAHFPRDAWALARFDGTALYEHGDPRQGEHPDWGTLVFNFGRHEVRNFLISNALYWLNELHVDGLRVDAVASMLYLDYSRNEGEWVPNVYGGRENLEAIEFIKEMNIAAYGRNPGIANVAEESTAWPSVSRPTHLGGLGFGFKWNMGWMHDTLEYFSKDPFHRRHHHNQLTFGFLYAWSENFILPLSHDEVVHGKRSLLDKMPGDRWQKFANLRALYGWMWGHPGKQLLFMGGEFGQWREWAEGGELDWHLLDETDHAGLMRLVGDLNRIYRAQPALWERDADPSGFQWIDPDNADENILAFLRYGEDGSPPLACIANLSPVPRPRFRVGLPHPGVWDEALNTDARIYGGTNTGNGGSVTATDIPSHGLPASAELTLPPLATLWLTPHR